jgi:hypothetical protein
MAVDIQNGGIVFGDWKLVPIDAHNWELCHKHTPKKSDGAPKWNHCKKYYDEYTIDSALRYAADQEIKRVCIDEALTIQEALDRWEAILKKFIACISDVADILR